MSYKSKKFRFTLTVLVSALLFSALINAQTKKIAFEKYGIAEGLPEEVARNFVQDHQGFIWIATQNGLAKFDGYKMEVHRGYPSSADSLHLRNLASSQIIVASNDILWIGGSSRSGGIASFNPKTEKFTNYGRNLSDSTKVPYQNNRILFEDILGSIWFVSDISDSENYLCKIDPKTKKISRYPYLPQRILRRYSLVESKNDSTLWLLSDKKDFLRYNYKQKIFNTVFTADDLIPGTKSKDSIFYINEAPKNGLILMTSNKYLYTWDPLRRQVRDTYEITKKDTIYQGSVFEDPNGDIWVTSKDKLTKINPTTKAITIYKFGEGPLNFESKGTFSNILQETQNEDQIIFNVRNTSEGIGYRINVLQYDLKSKRFFLYDAQFNDSDNEFENVFSRRTYKFDKTGLLWSGMRPNLYKEASKKRQISLYKQNPANSLSIPSDTIFTIFETANKDLWIGTFKGVALKNKDDSFTSYGWFSGSKTGSNLGIIANFLEDSNGILWTSGNGVFRWSEAKNSFEMVLPDILAPIIMEDHKDRIWVSTLDDGIYVLDNNSARVLLRFDPKSAAQHGLTSNRIGTMYLDSENEIWLGDRGNDFGLYKYNEAQNKFIQYTKNSDSLAPMISNEIRKLLEDDRNRLWIATDGGLQIYDRENDRFVFNNDSINLPSISQLLKAPNGKMWASTYSGGGLALVGPDINDVTMYGESKGLLHNDIENMAFDDLGKLWLPTERGLSVLDTLSKTFTSYSKKDGFQIARGRTSITKTKNGDIWIGADKGLSHIKPDHLAKTNQTKPEVYITAIKIMDSLYSAPDGSIFTEAVSYTDDFELQHWQKDLTFNFVGLHYLRPEDNQYSWKLDNYDEDWSEPSMNRSTSYTNLSPGTYTFRVKASNADGVWNDEGAFIKVVILPPWWLTWWAYFLYALILTFIGYRFHLLQKQKTLRKERERTQQKELEQAKEIEKAYTDLKNTQAQLIQSEKMASLGELTAGIAHEIQNPLNFVNNFSEVSNELIDEMTEELDKGEIEEAKDISKDIKQNLEKIIHHGKRADSIVKGMLQHSRASGNKKEATNINALADEYLRLAFHGLRAKDKSFNAELVTDFDESIKSINVIPQDIGRVILNLLTNAFYAVNEKKKLNIQNYEPTVSISTKKEKDIIKITVRDNGNGMPDSIKEKIFQPFFTTKPTGQGTGLGLSMSYDIITKSHGGELKVETKPKVGTEFIISLPL